MGDVLKRAVLASLSASVLVIGTQAAQPSASLPQFADVTTAAGIRFRHTSGAFGKKYLPETMGSGLAFFDADNDGDQDLYFANGRSWPGQPAAGGAAFYRNNGSGGFVDATRGSGLD